MQHLMATDSGSGSKIVDMSLKLYSLVNTQPLWQYYRIIMIQYCARTVQLAFLAIMEYNWFEIHLEARRYGSCVNINMNMLC